MTQSCDTPALPAFPYDGPAALQPAIVAALTRVVDPEVALSIVDLGLVYGFTLDAQQAQVRMTMTSPACPVSGLIVDDVENELDQVLPPEVTIRVSLVWEPAWSPDRMSERARHFMQWQ
jgi:metal-sulfur cluster biosynthetic enzyme